MRLTIERMRTLVLVAGVLLVAALVTFLTLGKWKNPLNRRDIPKRLGIDIQQEANGVTYTQARGGHTLFKLHASKVVQLKDNNAILHDVKIELYGTDGRRVDRIEGAEFEYDQKAGTAKAAGPVEITLMRPGATPAVAQSIAAQSGAIKSSAARATPASAANGIAKNTPAGVAEKAAESGEIHVKTSGLTFDQNSEVATTSQRVDFSLAQGAGSSMGATYNAQQSTLVLDKTVELTTRRGAETVKIHAQHAEIERDNQICRLRAATANFRGGKTTAGNAKILFREDGSAQRLEATDGFTLTTATGGHLTAPSGQMDFSEHNQPRHGHLEGGVTMDSASESGSGATARRRQMHGNAPTAELEFTAQGDLRHVHLERQVDLHSEDQSGQEAALLRVSRTWRSPLADVDFHKTAHGQIEPAKIHGTNGVVITGESQRGKGAIVPSRLAASQVTGEFGPSSVLTTITGEGEASLEQTTETGTRQTTRGDRLVAHFAPTPATGSKMAAKATPESQVQSATVEGHVILVQQPTQKPGAAPSAPLRATAGRADYAGEGEWLHLTLNPHVEDRGLQVTADKVDVSQSSGDAFAHGNVKASWTGTDSGNSAAAGRNPQSSVALGEQGPAHAIAAEAQLHQATNEATFRGKARLWQQANSVSAPVIVLNRTQQTMIAHTSDAAQPVRAVLLSASGAQSPTELPQKPGKTTAPTVIRVRGGDLRYSDAERKAVMHSGILGSVVAETATATSVSNEVELTLLPAGNHAGHTANQADKEHGQGQVDHLTARGRVLLTSAGRRGTGELLVYSSETGEYVLTGTAAAPPKMIDPERGTVTGEAVIFQGRDDSVRVEGGKSKTTTETTAPKRGR